MDSILRGNSSALDNLFSPVGSEYSGAHRMSMGTTNPPTHDVRYPAYASAMSDGRLVTDYRPQCSKNIRTGSQFHTKHWMIQHATDLMEESRRRQVEGTGASLPMASTVPPPAAIVHSTPFTSDLHPTGFRQGVGVERANANAPALFGTFSYEPSIRDIQMNRKNVAMTVHEEGGRNSMRGHY